MKEEKVYYRIYFNNERVVFPCMQDFDEGDYNQDGFLNYERYDTEQDAKNAFILMRYQAQQKISLKDMKMENE